MTGDGARTNRESEPLERPKLRPVESFTVRVEGGERLVLRDPIGYVEDPIMLTPASGLLLRFFDGQRSAEQIAIRVRLEYGFQLTAASVAKLAGDLDELGFLDSPRFAVRRRRANESYRRLEKRPARFAGDSYPEDPEKLRAFLAKGFAGIERPAAEMSPTAIIAPHVDLRVADGAYAKAYRAFIGGRGAPDLFVILGTAHGPISELLAASRVPYDTPLGPLPTDAPMLDRIAELYPGDLFLDEAAHRTEHSVEFQVLYLRYLFGDAVPPVIPVLCRSIEEHVAPEDDPTDHPMVRGFLGALRQAVAEQGKRATVIAGADLAHVGPRFGDSRPIDAASLDELARDDRETLDAAAAGEVLAFYRKVTAGGNPRRICGLTPILLTLLWTAGGPGRIADYRQWVEDGSCVSFAAAEFDG